MRRMWWLLVGALLTACGPVAPSAQASPSPGPSAFASPAGSPSTNPSPTPHQTTSPSPAPVACWPYRGGQYFGDKTVRPAITDMRVGTHGTYDRLVIEFTSVGLPKYEIMPNQIPPGGGTTFMEDPKGDSVTVAGSYGVRLQIFDTDWMSDTFASGKDLKPGFARLKEVRVVGDFEAIATIAIGLGGAVCPTVTVLSSPNRLVIDFPVS